MHIFCTVAKTAIYRRNGKQAGITLGERSWMNIWVLVQETLLFNAFKMLLRLMLGTKLYICSRNLFLVT